MSLRRRITLLAALAVAVAVATASALAYVLVSGQLHTQVDSSLRDTASALQRSVQLLRQPGPPVPLALPPGVPADRIAQVLGASPGQPTPGEPPLARLRPQAPPSSLGQDRGTLQLLGADGSVLLAPGGGAAKLPVDARARRLARAGGASYLSDAHIGADHLRVLALALPPGTRARAVQVARSLNEVDSTLSHLRLILVLVAGGGIAFAVLLGALVSRTTVAPIRRLSDATEHITRTQDLARRVPVRGSDELSRLAGSFNAMLDSLQRSMTALDSSVRAQRQLVADASHELRTPVTSLRANVEVLGEGQALGQGQALDREEYERLLADVVEQTEELSSLIDDVIELARGDEPLPVREEVRLDRLVREAIERALRRAPGARIEHDLQPTLVLGDPPRLDRAVSNLLDNALKFGPPGEQVDVRVSGGELTVRDRGPGIPAAEAEHVFDRFYRGQSARALPGSGLGLAIVRQVAEAHGGSVSAEAAPKGGTVMRLRLPAIPLDGLAAEGAEPLAAG